MSDRATLGMREASNLIRAGRLTEGTVLLQRMLSGAKVNLEVTNPAEGAPREFADDDPSPLHLVMTQESEETVQASLEKLPAIYREVLLLRFQEELGLMEIASVLSAPLSTVKSRLYRGLEDLRTLLAGEAA